MHHGASIAGLIFGLSYEEKPDPLTKQKVLFLKGIPENINAVIHCNSFT